MWGLNNNSTANLSENWQIAGEDMDKTFWCVVFYDSSHTTFDANCSGSCFSKFFAERGPYRPIIHECHCTTFIGAAVQAVVAMPEQEKCFQPKILTSLPTT